MIWALIAAAIVASIASGGGRDRFEQLLAQWKRAIKKVDDPQRRAAGIKAFHRLEGALVSLNEVIDVRVPELARVHERYESTLDDYQEIIDGFGPELLAVQLEMVASGAQLRTALGPEVHAETFKSIYRRLERQQRRKEKRAAREKQKKRRRALSLVEMPAI